MSPELGLFVAQAEIVDLANQRRFFLSNRVELLLARLGRLGVSCLERLEPSRERRARGLCQAGVTLGAGHEFRLTQVQFRNVRGERLVLLRERPAMRSNSGNIVGFGLRTRVNLAQRLVYGADEA